MARMIRLRAAHGHIEVFDADSLTGWAYNQPPADYQLELYCAGRPPIQVGELVAGVLLDWLEANIAIAATLEPVDGAP